MAVRRDLFSGRAWSPYWNIKELNLEHQEADMQWWGYSKEHGWVVLDRRIPCNVPGIKKDLLFMRCRDSVIFDAKRETWIPPSYRFAPNYLRDLASPASDEAAAELETYKAKWPEFERELQRECQETQDRADAIRLRQEKAEKQAAADIRKQTAFEKKKQQAAAQA